MVVKFSLDSDALLDKSIDLSTRICLHKELISRWRKCGVLSFNGKKFSESEVFKTIGSLDQQLKLLWQTAASHNHKNSVDNWDGCFPTENIDDFDVLTNKCNVFFLDQVRASLLGMQDHEIVRKNGLKNNAELCRFNSSRESLSFSDFETIQSSPLLRGENSHSEFFSRFGGEINYCTNVVAVDRYMVENHIGRSSRGEPSFIDRLINLCNRKIIGKISLTIISTVDEMSELSNYISGVIDKEKFKELKIISIPGADLARVVHYRYVRFDYKIFTFDAGLDILGGQNIRSNSIVGRFDYSLDRIFSEDELKIRGHSGRNEFHLI